MFLESLPYLLHLSAPTSLFPSFIVTFVVFYVVYQRYFSSLSDIPGPFLASLTRYWMGYHVYKGEITFLTPKLHQKYGPLVRIAPNEVSISDAHAIKVIYGVSTVFQKSDFYNFIAPPVKTPLGGMFSQRDEELHTRRRRIVSPIYTMTNVLKSEPYIDKCIGEFLPILHERAEKMQSLDLGRWLRRFCHDVIGELFFGADFGFLKPAPGTETYLDRMGDARWLIPLLACNPTLIPFLIFLPRLWKAQSAFWNQMTLAKARVDQRNESKEESDRRDMLSQLFTLIDKHPEYNLNELYPDAFDAIAAGSDPTATAIQSVLYYILKHPTVHSKLVSELSDASAAGKLSSPIKYNEAIKLPYLVAVCKEGTRHFPSLGLHLPRLVPKGGAVIAGRYFTEGTRVGINPFAVHNDISVFGHDAASFNPERWFRPEAKEMDRFIFQYGAGPRECIGKNVSLCEIYKLIPEILRNFDIELKHPHKAWDVSGSFFTSQEGVEVKVTVRGR